MFMFKKIQTNILSDYYSQTSAALLAWTIVIQASRGVHFDLTHDALQSRRKVVNVEMSITLKLIKFELYSFNVKARLGYCGSNIFY